MMILAAHKAFNTAQGDWTISLPIVLVAGYVIWYLWQLNKQIKK